MKLILHVTGKSRFSAVKLIGIQRITIAAVGLLSVFLTFSASAQSKTGMDEDATYIRSIFAKALTEGATYDWLHFLSTKIGGRLAGSPQAAAAVEYTRQEIARLGLDTVWLQPCVVPHWVRGEKELVRLVNSERFGSVELRALALGNSAGTGPAGISAEVVEVFSLDELEKLGKEKVEGRIVFFNRPFDNGKISTFHAYGGAVDQRGSGPSRASKLGAIGAVVRSMTGRLDDIPHTGGTFFEAGVKPIPAVAISTKAADLLSQVLKIEKAKLYIRTSCQNLPPAPSFNVIGEIKGSENPDEILLVGGHLDSWDVGAGAHDDGAGCVQSMEVLRLLKKLNYLPRRTIRCVLFMNEENGLVGGTTYAEVSNQHAEFHLLALESDAGGFTPHGFSCDGVEEVFSKKFKKLNDWLPLLEPYGLLLSKGGSGADISPLKSQNGLLCGLRPDSQRYFDYHHTEIDTIEAVHPRELALGAAAMTALIYLVDKYGLD
jgi:hypothetical protein